MTVACHLGRLALNSRDPPTRLCLTSLRINSMHHHMALMAGKPGEEEKIVMHTVIIFQLTVDHMHHLCACEQVIHSGSHKIANELKVSYCLVTV